VDTGNRSAGIMHGTTPPAVVAARSAPLPPPL